MAYGRTGRPRRDVIAATGACFTSDGKHAPVPRALEGRLPGYPLVSCKRVKVREQVTAARAKTGTASWIMAAGAVVLAVAALVIWQWRKR